MKDIYSKARNVIIWLGKEQRAAQRLMAIRRRLEYLYRSSSEDVSDHPNSAKAAARVPATLLYNMAAIFDEPLFQRIWIIPEALSAEVLIVYVVE